VHGSTRRQERGGRLLAFAANPLAAERESENDAPAAIANTKTLRNFTSVEAATPGNESSGIS
jgi:hypothetical protein